MYKSIAPFYPGPIDSRCLQMEMSFFMLNKENADQLMLSFYEWCTAFLRDQCVSEWYWGQRKTKCELIPMRIIQNHAYSFGVDANVISDIVYDKKSFLRNTKRLIHDISLPNNSLDLSTDYFPFYEQQFSKLPQSSEEWKKRILSFFDEPNRICYSPVIATDIHGFAEICPYYSNTNLYHGKVSFSVFLLCVDQEIKRLSEEMSAYLCHSSQRFTNINGSVFLSPNISPSISAHMIYFGANVIKDGSHLASGFMPNEWYKNYYLCGIAWFNVISPLVQQHTPNLLAEALLYPSLAVDVLEGGGIAIGVKSDINLIDVKDLRPLKLLLNDALYPGTMSVEKRHILSRGDIGLITKPRRRWELLPVLENEILVTDTKIIFQHSNSHQVKG